jgi:hypothetical protein
MQSNTPQQIRISIKNDQQILTTTFKDETNRIIQKECISLLPS